jgi:hypothetical protein
MQSSQWVHVGSSTITRSSSKIKASTGHNAMQAAQPKQRVSSTTNSVSGIRATCSRRDTALSMMLPTPIFPLEQQ